MLTLIKSTAVCVLADSYHINLFCLSETWLTNLTTSTEFFYCIPPVFTLMHSTHSPRPTQSKNTGISGDGTAFLFREPLSRGRMISVPIDQPLVKNYLQLLEFKDDLINAKN
jgi:hypothetical protein